MYIARPQERFNVPAIMGGLVLLLVAFVFFTSTEGETVVQPVRNIGTDACLMSQEFVLQNLKAPSTAEFPEPSRSTCDAARAAGIWTVHSYVDAQNGFGAMLRTDYTVKMTYNESADSWTLVDMALGSE